jgi:hypothetical protein
MIPTTTKQLMDQSKLFRFLFWGSIASIVIGLILCTIFPFTDCNSYSAYSCSWWYYSYPYQCTNNGKVYCCPSSSSYCSYSYCYEKPYTYSACIGLLIAGSSLLALGGLLAIFVFVMFCNFRSKIRNGGYIPAGGYGQIAGYPQPPIVIYSDQRQQQQPYYPQQQQQQQQQ